jgi:hypothetical protein
MRRAAAIFAVPAAVFMCMASPASAVDRDGDKLSDDLEARVAPLADASQANVIVVLRARARPSQVARLRAAAGLDVSQRFSLIDAVAGRVRRTAWRRSPATRSWTTWSATGRSRR